MLRNNKKRAAPVKMRQYGDRSPFSVNGGSFQLQFWRPHATSRGRDRFTLDGMAQVPAAGRPLVGMPHG
jgi:hypothetical protein